MQTIKARIVGEDADLGSFTTITLLGHELSREFAVIEVDDATFGKLKGNRFVEVLVKGKPQQEGDDAEAETPPAKKPRSGKTAEAETPPADPEA